MKSQEKRVTKLCEGMPNTARIRAILDAVRADDLGLRRKLLEATPKFSYRGHDVRVVDSIGAAENVGLRFDRTFYKLLAHFLALRWPEATEELGSKKVGSAIENVETELCALTSGAEIFAERIGLDLSQALAFSTAQDNELEGLRWPLEELSEDDMRRANEVADVFQKAWAKWGNSIEDFGEAA